MPAWKYLAFKNKKKTNIYRGTKPFIPTCFLQVWVTPYNYTCWDGNYFNADWWDGNCTWTGDDFIPPPNDDPYYAPGTGLESIWRWNQVNPVRWQRKVDLIITSRGKATRGS